MVIEEIDGDVAVRRAHEGAIYLHQGESYLVTKLDLSKRLDSGQTDIPRAREGGLKAQFWSVYIPSDQPNPARTVSDQIDVVHRMIERYPNEIELAPR